jgi:hypothetical protein
MRYTVSVTQDDIERGEQSLCRYCPVALGLRRAVPGAVQTFASDRRLKVMRQDGAWSCTIRTPPEVAAWINRFDSDGRSAVVPFSFEIPAPVWDESTTA